MKPGLARVSSYRSNSSSRLSVLSLNPKGPDSREQFSNTTKMKPSIFSAKTYEINRDPGGPKQVTCGLRQHNSKCPCTNEWKNPERDDYVANRSYREEIKQDLVNEMLKTFANGHSVENKQTISDQINAMEDIMTPAEVLAEKPKRKTISRRREAFRSHFSSSILPNYSSGRKTLTSKFFYLSIVTLLTFF